MINEEKSFIAMFKFLLWTFTLFLLCIVGISGVFADTYNTDYFSDLYYYDNRGSSITPVDTQWNESMQSYVSGNITTVANSYGAGVGFNSPIQLIKGHTYTFSISFIERNNIALSSKRNIALGSSPYNSGYNYTQNNYHADTIMSSIVKGNVIQYSFTALENANYIFMPWTTSSTVTQSYVFTQIIIDDLGSSGVSQQDINNSLNNQTNIINNSITASTNTITENSNNNRQAIIDNQNANNDALIDNNNSNTDKIIEENKKNFQECSKNINFELKKGKHFNTNGTLSNASDYYYTEDFIKVERNKIIIITSASGSNPGRLMYYNSNKVLIDWYSAYSRTLTLSSDTEYIRFSTLDPNIKLEYDEEVCLNKLDEQNKTSKGILGKLKDLFDNLFSNEDADISGLNNMVGWLPPGPVDSIINLPLSFFNSLTNTLTGTCNPVSLTIPFVNQTLVLPCFDAYMSKYLTGFSTLWTFVGVTLSVFILYYYLLALYKWVDDTLTFRENNLPGYYGDNWGGGA